MKLAWHEFIFDLPDDWEATRYSIGAPVGRFEFANRSGGLGRLSWEKSKRIPDDHRIVAEYYRHYMDRHHPEREKSAGRIQTVQTGRFYVGYRHEGEPCQAVAYLEKPGIILMWLFPDYSPRRLAEVWQPILNSFEPNDGSWRAWGGFGVQCRLPREFELEQAQVLPADVWLEFQHKNMHRVDIHRWGLPRELLATRDLPAFAAYISKGSGVRVLATRTETWRGMVSVVLTTETRGTRGMDRLFSSYWPGKTRFWHNTDEKRIYACVQTAPKKLDLLREEEVFPE
ncbi:MAG: hypothetical protein RRC34_15650 [Lentisphaeria bacterium]|nr:hypothetical protein [Lentisphaeria bacterium]